MLGQCYKLCADVLTMHSSVKIVQRPLLNGIKSDNIIRRIKLLRDLDRQYLIPSDSIIQASIKIKWREDT